MRSVLTRIYCNRNGLYKCWIAADRSKMTFMSIHIIANQNSYHDNKSTWQCFTHLFCPQLIRILWSRRCTDSFSIIAHPKFWYTAEEITKNSRYISIYIYVYRYSPLDNLFGFPILVGNRSCSYYLVLSDILWKCVNISIGLYDHGLIILIMGVPNLKLILISLTEIATIFTISFQC